MALTIFITSIISSTITLMLSSALATTNSRPKLVKRLIKVFVISIVGMFASAIFMLWQLHDKM